MRFKNILTPYWLIMTLLLLGCDPSWIDHFSDQSNQIWPDIQKGLDISDYSGQPEVQEQIKFYQQHPHILVQAIEPASHYLPYITQRLKARNLPTELALMPIVESSYDPFAHSKVGASGLWQMMPGTATNRHIKINYWYDGRRDIIDSTRGALDHLSYLYDLFHDWPIALAAYDAGEGRVANALSKLPTHSVHVFDLKLPKETLSYVTKILAIKAIITHPDRYHIILPPIENTIPFSTLQTTRTIHLGQLATSLKMSEKALRSLNPGFRRATTEPAHPSTLLIPNALYTKAIKVIFNSKPTTYIVKPGDSLSVIAQQFRTTVASIASINHLTNSHLKPGQLLTLLDAQTPVTHRIEDAISGDKKPGPKQKIHTAKSGDTLDKIAALYKVPKSHLIYWNHLSSPRLKKNQKIIIWLKSHTKKYVVKPKDSLSLIANHYHTSAHQLKTLNHLSSNQIKIGQTLKVPL